MAPGKGVEGFNRAAPVVGPSFVDVTEAGRKLRRGARLWTVAVATFKSETYRHLRLTRPTDEEIAEGAQYPAGFVHLPRGLEAEWVKQLVAEQLAHEFFYVCIVGEKAMATEIEAKSVARHCARKPADFVCAFEHLHAVAGLRERPAGGQTGEPAAEN